jgi:very-short-patch-repair endonuclease
MSKRAWALAARQHGVLTRRQLLELGFSHDAVRHRVAVGRLHLVARGIYAVGWPELSRERRWMIAVLACGEGAALSHHSAAALHEIGKERPGQIDVSVRRRCEHRRGGIRSRSRPSLPGEDIVVVRDIPVTGPTRTLLDLATELGDAALERTINEADKADLIDPDALRAALDGRAGQRGIRRLRSLLERHTFRLSDSDLEVLFRRLAVSSGLAQPRTKAWVNGFEVDFFWPDLGLVVETDGLRYHRTASSQARDRLRDQAHVAAGLTTLHFTHRQVKYEPSHVRKILRKTTHNLQTRSRP